MLCHPGSTRSFTAMPEERFPDLSAFVAVIEGGSENAPEWFEDFDAKRVCLKIDFQARREHRDDFVKAMQRHQTIAIEQEGADTMPYYKVHGSPFDDCLFYLIEVWASPKSLIASANADRKRRLAAEIDPFLVPSSESQNFVSLYPLGV